MSIKHHNNKQKPCFMIFLIMLFMIGCFSVEATELSVEASYQYIFREVMISGTVTSGVDQSQLSLMIVDPAGYPVEINQISVKKSGEFQFSCKLSLDAKTGDYTVKLNGRNAATFRFDGNKDLVELLNNGTNEEIALILENYQMEIGIDLKGDFKKLVNKNKVYEELSKITFDSTASIREGFQLTVQNCSKAEIRELVEQINEAEAGQIESLLLKYNSWLELELGPEYQLHKKIIHEKMAEASFSYKEGMDNLLPIRNCFSQVLMFERLNHANPDELAILLAEHQQDLDLNLEGYFKEVTKKDFIYQYLFKASLTGKEEVKKNFSQAVALALINEVDRTNIEKRFLDHYETLGLDLEKGYHKLGSKKQEVWLALLSADYNSIEELAAAFQKAVDKNLSTDGKQNPGGSPGRTVSSDSAPASTPSDESGNTNGFLDLSAVEWARDSIEFLSKKGIVSGVKAGVFLPEGNVTREQFLKMLLLAFEIELTKDPHSFEDVPEHSWAYSYIATGKKIGLIQGINEKTFGLNQEITRQDMAVLAYRMVQYTKTRLDVTTEKIEFVDASAISQYAEESISQMQQAGILKGMENGIFSPRSYSTRAMAAKVVYELMKFKE